MTTPRNDSPPAAVSIESSTAVGLVSLGEQLLRSDRTYFELAGQIEMIGPARLAWMSDLPRVPVACVVHISDPDFDMSPDWLETVEGRIRELGHSKVRIYLQEEAPASSVLDHRGYQDRLEIGYGELVNQEVPESDVTLRLVESEADWTDKLAIQSESSEASDGHAAPAADWVRLERSKCATGAMVAYIVERGDETCGTVCAMEEIDLLRIKNVLIRPSYRRQGCGGEVISVFRSLAKELGKLGIGVFGVVGTAGDRTYRSAGMEPVCRIVEWSRTIGPTA